VTRPEVARDDPHGRFSAWLLAAPDEDPPRDLAVHASVCRECQLEIAAFDMLTAIDLARAGMPPPRVLATRRRLGTAGRVAVAVSGTAALAAIGVGGWRLADAGALVGGPASEAPTQAVLGNTGHPEVTQAASPSARNAAPSERSASSPPSSPSIAPSTLPLPLPPAQTAPPTTAPSRTPLPSISTPRPTPVPTLQATAEPSPTPEPSTPEPSPSASAEAA
jgi:hypothetical protein